MDYPGDVCISGQCNAMTCPTEPFSNGAFEIYSGNQYMNNNNRITATATCTEALPPSPPPPPKPPPSPPPAPCCDYLSLTTVYDVPGQMLNCFTGPPFAKTDVVYNNRHVYRKGNDGPYLFFAPYTDDQGGNQGQLTRQLHSCPHPRSLVPRRSCPPRSTHRALIRLLLLRQSTGDAAYP